MSKNSDSVSANEKDEVISRLYSLRAGLSIVAQEREKADKIMNDAHRAKQNAIDAANERIEKAGNKLRHEKGELTKMTNKIDDLRRASKSAGIFPRLLIYGLYLAAFVVLLSAAVAGVGSGCFDTEIPVLYVLVSWIPDISFVDFLLHALVVFIGGAGAFGMITLFVCQIPFKFSLKERNSARNEISELKSNIPMQNKKIEDAQSAQDAEYDRKKRQVADADDNLAKAKQKATEHAMAGLAMIDALDNAYSDMIDIRDWQNTDIIIYALETRRSENIKEALQVVDGERRTERLEMAISDAGNAICQSINTGLRRLQSEMTRCFGILGQIIVAQTDRIAAGMQGLSAGIAANNSYLSSLTTQASMNNALLAKANENSTALAENVTALRTAAEYSAARQGYHYC